MNTVKEILDTKGRDVISVTPDSIVIEALTLMAERNIGAILVLEKSGEIAGILSERDFARKIIVKGRACDTSKVKDIMTSKIICAEPSTTLVECMNLMTSNRFRHLPIKENGKVVGVISIGDVVKALIEQQERIIAQQDFLIGQNERKSSGAV
jgi:CBS domain-containing protein